METTRGKVEVVFKRDKTWSVLLDDKIWYSAGFQKPNCEKGDTVDVAYVVVKGKYRNIESIEVVPEKEVAAKSDVKKQPVTTQAAGREDYWQNKEARDVTVQSEIRFQAARNASIEFVRLLLDKEALKLPAKGDKEEVIRQAVMHYTVEFYNDVKNLESLVEGTATALPKLGVEAVDVSEDIE